MIYPYDQSRRPNLAERLADEIFDANRGTLPDFEEILGGDMNWGQGNSTGWGQPYAGIAMKMVTDLQPETKAVIISQANCPEIRKLNLSYKGLGLREYDWFDRQDLDGIAAMALVKTILWRHAGDGRHFALLTRF